MPIVTRKTTDDEPIGADGRTWLLWAIAQIEAALHAGDEPPRFQRRNPWAFWLLAREVDEDPWLSERVEIDVRGCGVYWKRRRRRS